MKKLHKRKHTGHWENTKVVFSEYKAKIVMITIFFTCSAQIHAFAKKKKTSSNVILTTVDPFHVYKLWLYNGAIDKYGAVLSEFHNKTYFCLKLTSRHKRQRQRQSDSEHSETLPPAVGGRRHEHPLSSPIDTQWLHGADTFVWSREEGKHFCKLCLQSTKSAAHQTHLTVINEPGSL